MSEDTPESIRCLSDLVADATDAPPYTKKMALIECIPVLHRYAELLGHIARFEVDVLAIIEEYERESSMDVKLPGGEG